VCFIYAIIEIIEYRSNKIIFKPAFVVIEVLVIRKNKSSELLDNQGEKSASQTVIENLAILLTSIQ